MTAVVERALLPMLDCAGQIIEVGDVLEYQLPWFDTWFEAGIVVGYGTGNQLPIANKYGTYMRDVSGLRVKDQ